MIQKKKVLALIPARGGSKGLPHKNILPLCGKPLIAWTIEAAKQSAYIDRLILSSDDPEIMEAATLFDCEVPFQRPAHLAGDTATTLEVVLHAQAIFPEYDIIVVLQPTSPLRTTADIDSALEQMFAVGSDSCVSVTEPDKSPYWSYRLDRQGRLQPLLDEELSRKRRQELPRAYVLNGAIFIVFTRKLLHNLVFVDNDTVAYIMPPERAIDIDSALDLKIAALSLASTTNQASKDCL